MKAARRAALVAGVAFLIAIAGRALPVHAQSPEGHEGSAPIPKEVAERLRLHELHPLPPIQNTSRTRTRHLSTTAPLPPVSPRRSAAIQTLERPRISGYLFAAETGQPLGDTDVQLCPDEACRSGISAITDGAGYYEFAFDSLLQVVTDTEQSVGYYTPGEIHVTPHGGEHSAIYSVWYSGEDYRNRKHKHQLAYVYADRPSWGWEKETEGLQQFFVLHPPMDLPLQTEVDATQTPVVFVHGHAGRDSTWMGLRPSMENRGYQTWEVYYPGRDHIAENAAILRDAVDAILQHYDGAQVDMVTHSMGGPVSRSYAAGTARYPWDGGSTPLVNYTPKLRRLLQLAPTSSGVLNIVRIGDPFWRNRCAAALELFEALGFQDPREPALEDLAFASTFFEELSRHRMQMAAEDVLIVAGTRASLRVCEESRNQSDFALGNSSSSLLNEGVPLGLVYRDHAQMVGQRDIPHRLVWGPSPQPPSDSDDDPYNDALQLVELIDGFLSGDVLKVKRSLDVYIHPGPAPDSPQSWTVTVADRTSKPPRLDTRSNWPANQWDDGHCDTDFDAGGFWLRIDRWNPQTYIRQVRMCDPVQCECWDLRQATSTGMWFLDNATWGHVLPSSEFGYPYTVMVNDGTSDIQLGAVIVKPLQVVSAALRAGSRAVFLPIAFRAGVTQ